MSKYRWLGMMASPLVLAVLLLGLFQGNASASPTTPQATHSQGFIGRLMSRQSRPEQRALPLVSCSGDGCDGLYPQDTGCNADQRTVSGGVAYVNEFSINTPFNVVLKVELMWSPTCMTNWARVTNISTGSLTVNDGIKRGDGLGYVFESINLTAGSSTNSWMVYAPSQTGQAFGGIAGQSGLVAATPAI